MHKDSMLPCVSFVSSVPFVVKNPESNYINSKMPCSGDSRNVTICGFRFIRSCSMKFRLWFPVFNNRTLGGNPLSIDRCKKSSSLVTITIPRSLAKSHISKSLAGHGNPVPSTWTQSSKWLFNTTVDRHDKLASSKSEVCIRGNDFYKRFPVSGEAQRRTNVIILQRRIIIEYFLARHPGSHPLKNVRHRDTRPPDARFPEAHSRTSL